MALLLALPYLEHLHNAALAWNEKFKPLPFHEISSSSHGSEEHCYPKLTPCYPELGLCPLGDSGSIFIDAELNSV